MSTTYSVYLPNYSVGPDCYEAIPSVTARYGKKVVIIGGKTALSKAQDAILAAVKGHLDVTAVLWYGGNSTYENVDMLMNTKEVQEADMVFAVGGGRAVDCCKTMADKMGKPVFTFPTIASNCAACTAICVMYKQMAASPVTITRNTAQNILLSIPKLLPKHRKNFCGPALATHSAKNVRF